MNRREIVTVWPEGQAVNLGNLLIFRAEIEALSLFYNRDRARIYFTDRISYQRSPHYREILKASPIAIECFCREEAPEPADWPPADPALALYSYGSFKRLSLLARQTNRFPSLHWTPEVLQSARGLCDRAPLFTVHLKRQVGGPEESNATLDDWAHLFSENSGALFFLLGDDELPESIIRMPNVRWAKGLQIPLVVQLALCSMSTGFLGMASGICNAAVLSATPYVVIKHPSHHVREMELELGKEDRFDFAGPRQKMVRSTDQIEQLRNYIRILL